MEYKIVKVDMAGILGNTVSEKKTQEILNDLAMQGWRLVSVVPVVGVRMTFVSSTVAFVYHFERPLK